MFCSHLIEHLTPPEFERLIHALGKVLIPGGRVVIITPNPVNLHVMSETFYLDMSHVRPYPLPLIEQIFSEAGMRTVDKGWDEETVPRHPAWKAPLHWARKLILGKNYYQGEDTYFVAEK